jgi:HD-GYP domain-containing protein (c-di-GMP phosphodiesterase class II)
MTTAPKSTCRTFATMHAIPLCARIVAVADVFDALTSKRVYKDAIPVEEAKQIIDEEAGKHFDPVIVQAFDVCFPRLLHARDSIGSQEISLSSHQADEAQFPRPAGTP